MKSLKCFLGRHAWLYEDEPEQFSFAKLYEPLMPYQTAPYLRLLTICACAFVSILQDRYPPSVKAECLRYGRREYHSYSRYVRIGAKGREKANGNEKVKPT